MLIAVRLIPHVISLLIVPKTGLLNADIARWRLTVLAWGRDLNIFSTDDAIPRLQKRFLLLRRVCWSCLCATLPTDADTLHIDPRYRSLPILSARDGLQRVDYSARPDVCAAHANNNFEFA